MTKVSVIIPVYNVETYLEECLDSILNQTLQDFEIICVNDGSTDSSSAILERYSKKDSRVKVLAKENGGASSARNMALSYADGEYIYFMDSDDYIRRDALRLLYEKAEENMLDIALFGALCFVCDDRGTKKIYKDHYYTREVCLNEILEGKRLFYELTRKRRLCVTVWSQFFRREFLIESGIKFYESIINEDELFTPLVLIRARRVMCLPDNLYMRRDRPNSIMTSKISKKNVESLTVVFNKLKEELVLWENDYECNKGLVIRCDAIFNSAIRHYRSLDEFEQQKVFVACKDKKLILYKTMIEKEVTEHGNVYFFMRDIKNVMDCCKENGYIYTLKLVKAKIKDKLKSVILGKIK